SIVSRSVPVIPPRPAASALRLATCHAVKVSTGDPVTGTSGVVVVSSATVAPPAAARVASSCCTPPVAADVAGTEAANGLVAAAEADATAGVTVAVVVGVAALPPLDLHPD